MSEAVARKRTVGRELAALFQGRPRLQVGALLAGPVGWLVIGYLGSLAVLLIAAFWTVDPLSGEVVQGLSFENFATTNRSTATSRGGRGGRVEGGGIETEATAMP